MSSVNLSFGDHGGDRHRGGNERGAGGRGRRLELPQILAASVSSSAWC